MMSSETSDKESWIEFIVEKLKPLYRIRNGHNPMGGGHK